MALWQANYTKSLLEQKGYACALKIIQTSGDKSQQWNTSFDKLEGKGFFTKELEEALLSGEIDLAVHSHKDLPTENPQGLIIAGVSSREDASELLLIRKESVDQKKKFNLKQHARVGTSSARRKSQLLAFRPDIEIKDLRGNVPTRINKLRQGEYDAILIAFAGTERLKIDLSEFHCEKLNPAEFVPAPAQGALAWQIREKNQRLLDIIQDLNDLETQTQISVERRVLNLLDGGCQLPLGVYCEKDSDENEKPVFKIWVSKSDAWDKPPIRMYFEKRFLEDVAEEMTTKLNSIKGKSVFITRNIRPSDFMARTLSAYGFTVNGQALIEFKEILIETLPKCEWVFFSSKHAVNYFFRQNPELYHTKYGCIGASTAAELRQYGKRAEFIGQSTDTKLVAKQFWAKAGAAKVLFPIAKGSLQTIQQLSPKKDQSINLPVYETLHQNLKLEKEPEIMVFTSPSNVEAFFRLNTLSKQCQLVAIGDATGKALERKGYRNYVKPARFDDLGFVETILSNY